MLASLRGRGRLHGSELAADLGGLREVGGRDVLVVLALGEEGPGLELLVGVLLLEGGGLEHGAERAAELQVAGLLGGALGVLAPAEDLPLEVLEGDEHGGHVVEALPVERVLEHGLDGEPALLVHVVGDLAVLVVEGAAVPDALDDVFVGHLVEDAVAGEEEEVVVLGNLECLHVWETSYHVWVAALELQLGFRVSEGPGDGEPAWQHSDGPNDEIRLSFLLLSDCLLSAGRCGRLVHLASSRNDALVLEGV